MALRRQFLLCRQFCRHLGIAELASDEYEADDLIGTLATRCRSAGLAVTIVSCDKDLAQLIGPQDVLWDYADASEYHYADIPRRFGAAPERMADYLALRGDPIDNIPGVPGVGHKTAALLMSTYGSLDELFDALQRSAALPLRGAARVAQRLRDNRPSAYLSRELTRINCDAPLSTTIEDLMPRPPDLVGIGAFCAAQGFGTLLARQAERLVRAAAGAARPAAGIGAEALSS